MNGELIWVLSLLAVAIVLFATGRVRMDAVALFVIVAFALSGTLTVPEVFSGFSDPNVVPDCRLVYYWRWFGPYRCCHRNGNMAGQSGGQQ